jgi:methyltransferase (TIGR00027 family)
VGKGPSRTARKVALNLVTLGSRRGMGKVLPPGVADATARMLVESGAVDRMTIRLSRSRLAVGIYLAFDWMMPGQFEAFAHRKAFFERQVRSGIKAGVTQVLVLGAGYDTLGWRLAPEFADVSFFELDHPATARLKAEGIEAMRPRANLYLKAEDLEKRQLSDVLRADARWQTNARTVILAEGLLMYLPPRAVEQLFDQCAAVTGAGSRIVFTYVGTLPDGRPDAGPWTAAVLGVLRLGGEPWLWSIRPEDLGPFLERAGWTIAPEQPSRSGVEYFGVAVK